MNIMAEDEEVLLKTSPLSLYLRETCPDQDFETAPSVSDKKTEDITNRNKKDVCLIQLHVLKAAIHQAFEWMFPPVSDFIQHIETEFLPRYSSLALDSHLLLDADRQTIHAYCPKGSQDSTRQSPAQHHRTVGLYGHVLCGLAVLFTALAVLYQSAAESNFTYSYAALYIVVLLASTAYTLHWARTCWIFNSLKSLHQNSIQSWAQCLMLLNRQGVLLKKSIRYIQEVEVISRGFTMLSPYTPVVRLENAASSKQQRQCLALRKACFSAARAQFNALRDATLGVMKQLPLVAEIDHVNNYLAVVCLEDTAPWIKMTDIENDQDSLTELTGCFSLATLKVMNSLFLEQRSECIRRLVLSTCPDARLEPHITVHSLNSWCNIVSNISASCKATLEKLQRSYDCHRQRPSRNTDQVLSERPPQGGGEMDRVGCAVRSLRLHLEATLNRVISVEEALEGRDQQLVGGGDRINAVTSEMLESVQRELTASQDCLQEAASSLEKMSSKEISCKQSRGDGSLDAEQSNLHPDSREPILLLPMRDTEIEFDDQIFEAYTDTDPGQRDDEEWGEEISDAEKVRRRREAEETKRLLQELRSVLTVRKAERERMKSEKNRTAGCAKGEDGHSDVSRSVGKEASPKLATDEDLQTDSRVAENKPSSFYVQNKIAKDTILADRQLDSLEGSSDLKIHNCQDGKKTDSKEKVEGRTGGFSRDVSENDTVHTAVNVSESGVRDSDDGRMVDLSRDVGESEPRRSAAGLASSLGDLKSAKSTNQSHASEYDTTVASQSQDSLDPKNQFSHGYLSDAATQRPSFNPTEGQRQFGLSFLPSLAAEAARKSRQCRQEEETFFGSDEDSEESEDKEKQS
ncbi:vezatin-like [Patiria miniata]|uniref:Vezatin n=1 Tax=Patiria miniata TaxID=46514 RepID=A0A913Z0S6_PATMI|nr:vezatin-like [Patiria miniata]